MPQKNLAVELLHKAARPAHELRDDVRIDGKRERKFSADWATEAEALAALSKRLTDAAAGRVSAPGTATLGALAEQYLAYKANAGKRSIRGDPAILGRRLLPAFGADLPLARLSAPLIAMYERRRRAARSPRTQSRTSCRSCGTCSGSAVAGAPSTPSPDITMPKKPEGRSRYLDAPEIARLLAACRRSRNPYLAAIVTLAINAGMRKAEILGIAWERVDLATARLTLYRTKSGKPRGVPINRAVYDALVALEPDGARRAGRLVFARRDGAAWRQIRRAFQTALDRAGIEGFRFHDLRHSAASHLVMCGASLEEVQEILGHADFKMTLRYAHLSPAHLRGAVDRLDGLTPGAGDGHIGGHIVVESAAAASEVADSLVRPRSSGG